MRIILRLSRIHLLRPWTIQVAQALIPVYRVAARTNSWKWTNGERFKLEFGADITVSNDHKLLAIRKKPPLAQAHGDWAGVVPVSYLWRGSAVTYRDDTGALVMYGQTGCMRPEHPLVIQESVASEAIPVLVGIAMATFRNYDE